MGLTIGLLNTCSILNIGDAAIYSALTALAPEAKVVPQFADAAPEYIPGLQILPEIGCCDGYISVGGDIFNKSQLINLCRRLQERHYQPVLLIQSPAYGADNDLVAAEIFAQVPQLKIFKSIVHSP